VGHIGNQALDQVELVAEIAAEVDERVTAAPEVALDVVALLELGDPAVGRLEVRHVQVCREAQRLVRHDEARDWNRSAVVHDALDPSKKELVNGSCRVVGRDCASCKLRFGC